MTPSPSLPQFFIEAEDYNFAEGIGCDDNGNPIGDPATGGSFIDDPTPSAFVGSFRVNEADGYVDRVGGRGIDFFDTNTETGSAPNNAYRFCDPVGTQMTGDARRQKYIDASLAYSGTEDSIPDFHVHQIVAGEWLNYTRTFTEGVYHIYLRASSGAAQGVRLDKVTGNRSMPDQTTEAIGVFNVAAGAFGYSALTDQFGQPLPVVLSGVETLRLTALDAQNNLSLNFLILVSAGDVGELPPYIAQVSPGPDEQNVWPTRGIEVEIRNSGSQVDTGTIQVFLDDQNVTASATITGTAQGATVSYRPTNYQSGATHTVRVEFADNATPPQTHSGEWSFTMSEFSTGPVEAFAAGSVDGQWFGVCFSGPIDPATAGNPANYRINGTAPASAEVRDDGLSVRLQRSGGAISGSFDVVVENVLDWAGTAIPSATLSGQTHGLTGVVLRRTETDPTFEGGEWTCASDWIEITADGSDIWNEADAGRLVYETITGNFDKRVQVHSFSAVPDPWGKAIIDARASVDGWSRHVFVAAAPQPPGNNFTVVQERLADFGASQRWDAVGMDYLVGEPFPKWIRLQRVGNVFTAFGGSDGNNWTFLQAVERDMPETMVVGPALTSHQNGTPVTVRFSNYSDVTFENVTVTMVEHPQSQAVTAPATVVFEAQAEVVNAPPGELLYTWERSTDAGATWEVVQIGPDGTYSERVTTGGTRLYRAIASAGGAQATSDTATLEVEPAPGANIVWVSFHPGDETPSSTAAGAGFDEAPDVAYTRLIEESGHVVTRFVTVNDIQQSALDFLNTFDLVIISRSVDSGHYGAPNADGNPEGPRERSAWHGLTVPIINMAGYTLRGGALDNSTRLGFTTGNTMVDTVGTIHLAVNDPAHPVFTGIPLDGGNVMARPYADQVSFGETLQRGISVNAHDPVGGIVLATTPVTFGDPATTVDGMIIGEWQAGAILGQGEILAGHRLVFLSGSREATGLTSHEAGIFDLHPDGAQLFLNAVNYMTGHEIVVPPALPVVVHSPDDEEENVWQGTAVEVTLLDGAAPIVAASVTVWFNGEDVTASATITDTAEGVEVSYQPALVAGGTHSVRVEFSDDAGGEHSAEWSFTVATFDLPPEPFSGNIIIVTEQPQLEQPGTKNLADYLRLLGYTVETGAFHGQDGQLTAGEIEQLEAADLVLVHRSTTSGNYHEARTPQWNNLNVPLLLGSAYLARSTHWAWTPGAQTRSTLEGLEVVDSTHPIFAGLGSTLFARPIDIDHLNSPDAGNGELLATADGNLAVAAWEGAGFFQGTDGQQHVERRVFFPLMRYHETGDTAGSFADYSDNGLRLLANAVEYTMTGAVTWPPPIDGPVLGISIGAEGQIILDWTAPGFRLQSADTVTGPWADVAGGDEPPVEVTPTEAMQFYQLVQ